MSKSARRRLRLEGDEPVVAPQHLGQFLLGRQEHALADDVVDVIEEPVDRLQPEARHAHVVGIRKRECHAEAARVGLGDVADLACEGGTRAVAQVRDRWFHDGLERRLRLTRRRTPVPWVLRVYHRREVSRGARRCRCRGAGGCAPASVAYSCRRRKAGTSNGDASMSTSAPVVASRNRAAGSSMVGRRPTCARAPPVTRSAACSCLRPA